MPAIAALTIAGIASQAIGAKVSSNAAKSAAKTQSDSADKALALQKTQYEEQKARQAPYIDAGQSSVSRLNSLMTPNAQGQYQPFGAPPSNGMMPPPMAQPSPMGGGQNPFRLPNMGGGMAQPQGGMMPQQPGAMPSQMGGTVKMQAPDGSTKDVPMSQKAYFEAKGAKVIG